MPSQVVHEVVRFRSAAYFTFQDMTYYLVNYYLVNYFLVQMDRQTESDTYEPTMHRWTKKSILLRMHLRPAHFSLISTFWTLPHSMLFRKKQVGSCQRQVAFFLMYLDSEVQKLNVFGFGEISTSAKGVNHKPSRGHGVDFREWMFLFVDPLKAC